MAAHIGHDHRNSVDDWILSHAAFTQEDASLDLVSGSGGDVVQLQAALDLLISSTDRADRLDGVKVALLHGIN